MSADIESVAAIRAQLWDAGFRPLAVLNFDKGNGDTAGKAPIGNDWGNRARQDPPECLRFDPVPHALNTGILCDGLRAIDIDIDDADIAKRCCAMVQHRFGEAPTRYRANSPRCLILYRAAEGTPPKRVLKGSKGKIEVLGRGQQFVAFGRHPTGAYLEWFPDAPGTEKQDNLPAIAEADLIDFLNSIAPVIEAEPLSLDDGERKTSEPQADPLRIAAALDAIPNSGPANWEAWNRVAMAVWRATDGGDMGWHALDAWSRRNSCYNAKATRERWEHYSHSPPTEIGAGTLFYMAEQASANESQRSSTFLDPWDDPPPPPFPKGVLPQVMEEMIFALALRDGVCPGALAMAYLAAVSGAANKSSRFHPYQNSDWSVPPIIWTMIIADSGQRKTAIEDRAFAGLRNAHGNIMREYWQQLKQWRRLSKQEQAEQPKPEEPRSLLVEDITAEKLQVILANSDRGTFMLRDEIAGLLEFGRYSNGKGASERAFYLQAYEGGSYTVHRLTRDSFHIEVAAVALYGAIQPERLRDFPDLSKDGLLQRINMARATTAGTSRDDVKVTGLDEITEDITQLTQLCWHRYHTTPEGSALIRETEKMGRNLSELTNYGQGFQGTCSKLHGTHARYALLLHLLDAPQAITVSAGAVARAGRLVREFLLPQARNFFSSLADAPPARLRDIAGYILVNDQPRFRVSDFTANVRSCRGLDQKRITEALGPLVAGGWLDPETPYPTNKAWKVNPQLRAHFQERAAAERARRQEAQELWREIAAKSDKPDEKGGCPVDV
jgi:hypothetical protein